MTKLKRTYDPSFSLRYFDGTEDEKKQKYNYWHGVLADFFEQVQDMDRKAEVNIFI